MLSDLSACCIVSRPVAIERFALGDAHGEILQSRFLQKFRLERTKPAADIFATALAKLTPLTPDEVVVVGDTPYDVEAAGRCGIATVGLRSGRSGDEALLGAGAIALHDDVAASLRDDASSPSAHRQR